jgi:protoporphyrinogen oxidase
MVAEHTPGLELGREVTRVHLEERWAEIADGERLSWERMVSTIPLPALLDSLANELPEEVRAARAALRWVRCLNLALGVEGEAPSTEHWLYFPDPDLPFYRVGFPSNHGTLAPSGHHTVSIEVSLDPGRGDVNELAMEAEKAVVAAGLLDSDAVKLRRVTVLDPAYVVFDHPRREAVALLRRYLRDHGVVVAGRWAEWKYSAMEDAVLDGMRVARSVGKDA